MPQRFFTGVNCIFVNAFVLVIARRFHFYSLTAPKVTVIFYFTRIYRYFSGSFHSIMCTNKCRFSFFIKVCVYYISRFLNNVPRFKLKDTTVIVNCANKSIIQTAIEHLYFIYSPLYSSSIINSGN